MADQDDGYHGEPNKETWTVKHWLQQGGDASYRQAARQALFAEAHEQGLPATNEQVKRHAAMRVGSRMRNRVGAVTGEGVTTVQSELFTDALARVDWQRLGRNYVDEVVEQAHAELVKADHSPSVNEARRAEV